MYESARRAFDAGVAFPGNQSSSTAWVKAHWILANGMGMTSRDFILNMQRVFRGEGTVSPNAEIVPPPHEKTIESGNPLLFTQRCRANLAAIENHRRKENGAPRVNPGDITALRF